MDSRTINFVASGCLVLALLTGALAGPGWLLHIISLYYYIYNTVIIKHNASIMGLYTTSFYYFTLIIIYIILDNIVSDFIASCTCILLARLTILYIYKYIFLWFRCNHKERQ